MTNRIVWHIAGCVTALMLFPTSSRAQSSATTFDELRRNVRDGNEVIITNADGQRTRGKLTSMTASSLELGLQKRRWLILMERTQQTFTDAAVVTVTRVDSTWDGGFLGFVAGSVPVALGLCNSGDGEEAAWNCLGGLVFAGPLAGLTGGAIGAWIDGRMNQIVYRTAAPVRPVTITVLPLLNPKAPGASLRLGF